MSSSRSSMDVRRLSALKQRVITAGQNPLHFSENFRGVGTNLRRDLVLRKPEKNQSQMELLTAALVIVLLTTTSAKPIGWRRHYDADITDNNRLQQWQDRYRWWYWWCNESSAYGDSSSESDQSFGSSESSESSESRSSESRSSESRSSEESSEEVVITERTTTAMRRTTTPEPDTMSTDEPTVSATPPPATATAPAVTTAGDVTGCVTHDIPTAAPITENRGDN